MRGVLSPANNRARTAPQSRKWNSNAVLRARSHEDLERYEYCFWTNAEGKPYGGWSTIPRDTCAGRGAGGNDTIVVRSEEPVIALAPGSYLIAGAGTPEQVRLVPRPIASLAPGQHRRPNTGIVTVLRLWLCECNLSVALRVTLIAS